MDMSITIAAGILVPFIISFLKDVTWSDKVKQLVAFVISTVVAVGITVVDQGVALDSIDTLLMNLGVIFTTASVFYLQYFQGTSVNAKIENIGVGAGKAE